SKNAGQCKVAVSPRFRWRRRVDHALPHRLTGTKLVLVGNDDVIAFGHATKRLGKVESAKSHVDGSPLHNPPVYHQRLVHKKSAGRHEQGISWTPPTNVYLS